ncbi:hypothetical protein OU426_03135 [Frigidibacter sp. RF13]|uniref:hypothetical protein n=1 Tax=Frigidibacter sp. RF13 TaxID=2997340 RepID=UPI002271E812|nr:hypothetical protein [Frigidibacter sp. RF13]MCY1125837.1 hypothetical protein [Frigidibacter sp. RF13]
MRLLSSSAAMVFCLLGQNIAHASECATPGDMKQGLRLVYGADGTTKVKRRTDGLIEFTEIGSGADGGDLVYASRYGLYDLEAAAAGAGAGPDRRVTYDYDGGPLVEPAPGATGWVGQVIATFPGDAPVPETAAFVFGGAVAVAVGDCSFDAVTVEATFIRERDWEGQSFLYFPDFGFATLIGRAGPEMPKERYELTAIEPLPAE